MNSREETLENGAEEPARPVQRANSAATPESLGRRQAETVLKEMMAPSLPDLARDMNSRSERTISRVSPERPLPRRGTALRALRRSSKSKYSHHTPQQLGSWLKLPELENDVYTKQHTHRCSQLH